MRLGEGRAPAIKLARARFRVRRAVLVHLLAVLRPCGVLLGLHRVFRLGRLLRPLTTKRKRRKRGGSARRRIGPAVELGEASAPASAA